jgi:hypothetical protein
MTRFGIIFASGNGVIIEATSSQDAKAIARNDNPEEEILQVVYLTGETGEV